MSQPASPFVLDSESTLQIGKQLTYDQLNSNQAPTSLPPRLRWRKCFSRPPSLIFQDQDAFSGCVESGPKIGTWAKRDRPICREKGPAFFTLGSQNMAQNSCPLFFVSKRGLGGPKRGLVFVVSITAPFLNLFFFLRKLFFTQITTRYAAQLRRARIEA